MLSGEVLEDVVLFKYLDIYLNKTVLIDKHLNFDLHIKHVGIKLAITNGMLFRERNFLSKTFPLQMDNSYAKSMASYGILTYGSAKKKTKYSSIFVNKTHFQDYLSQEEKRPYMLSSQALQLAVSF